MSDNKTLRNAGEGEKEDAHADVDSIRYTRYRFTQINPRGGGEEKTEEVEFVSRR